MRSHAKRCEDCHLTLLSVTNELKWSSAKLRTLLLRRLRLPLDLDDRRCKCGGLLDSLGDHRAACSTVGFLQTRAIPLERAWARVCREAGGRVKTNSYLRDLNLTGVHTTDERRLEVVVSGLPLHHGAQVAVDATLVTSGEERQSSRKDSLARRRSPGKSSSQKTRGDVS